MSNEGMKLIGLRIKARREELNLTQEELSRRLGYKSKSSLNKIELGVQGLRQSKIKAIADALQTTPSYIMGWVSEDSNDAPAPDPLRAYYDRLEAFLQESPAHRALVDSAAHVRAEDAGIVLQLLARFADPDSAAPELPEIENANKSLRTANYSCERANNSADEIELTAETLRRVTNSPEVLAEDAAYIKSRRNAEKKALSSSHTTSEGRRSG